MEDFVVKLFNGTNIKFDASTAIRIGVILLLTIAAYIALTIINKKLKKKFNFSSDLRKAQIYKISMRIVRIIITVIAVIAILQSLGINLTGLSGIFGVVIIMLVLAIKDAFQDIFNGFMIMSDRYYSVGDAVEYEGKDGVVISFTARTTKIELLDDRSVLSVANRNISKIRKLTHLVDIDLPLSYDLSGNEAYSLLTSICMKISSIDGVESCELKGTQDFAASAIIYKIRFFCEPNNRPDIRRAVIKMIQDELDNAGIRIPYQQIDIHER